MGKNNGKKWIQIWILLLIKGVKLPRKKKWFLTNFALLAGFFLALVLLPASVKRCFVSRMRDFYNSYRYIVMNSFTLCVYMHVSYNDTFGLVCELFRNHNTPVVIARKTRTLVYLLLIIPIILGFISQSIHIMDKFVALSMYHDIDSFVTLEPQRIPCYGYIHTVARNPMLLVFWAPKKPLPYIWTYFLL